MGQKDAAPDAAEMRIFHAQVQDPAELLDELLGRNLPAFEPPHQIRGSDPPGDLFRWVGAQLGHSPVAARKIEGYDYFPEVEDDGFDHLQRVYQAICPLHYYCGS